MAKMEPLSSFAISLAAGYAIELVKYVGKPTILTQIKRAFEAALVEYSPNTQIREQDRRKLRGVIEILQISPATELSEETEILEGTARFFTLFEQHLAGQEQAYNFIKEVRDADRHREVLSTINDVHVDILEQFNRLQESSPELEDEYRRQLDQYKLNLENFRPVTALQNLEALEGGFDKYNFEPNNSIKSNLEYLKARCMAFDSSRSDETDKAFIRAFKLDGSLLKVKESACLSYYKIGETNDAETVVDEILQIDEFNAVAWSVRVLLSPEETLSATLSMVPKIVVRDLNFKRIVFLSTRLESKHNDLQEAYDTYEIWVDVDLFDGSPTRYENFHERLFLIESSLSLFSKGMFISYEELVAETKILNNLIGLIDNFLEAMNDSEISSNFEGVRFYRHYLQYILEKNPHAVFKMKEHYEKIGKIDGMKLLLLANALQIIGELDDAIAVINQQEKKTEESLSLEMVCWSKKEDAENVALTAHEFLKTVTTVNQYNLEHLFIVAGTLKNFEKLGDFDVIEFTEDKEFENNYSLLLIQEYVKLLKDEVDDNTLDNLRVAFEEIGDSNTKSRNHLALIYHLMNEHSLAVKVYETFIDKSEESEELFKYLVSLYHTKQRRSEVLDLLGYWRKNFSFQPQLLKIELQFRTGLFDFETCLEICKNYFEHDKTDPYIIANYAMAIDNIENSEAEITDLVNITKDVDFEIFGQAIQVADVLIKTGHPIEGLNIYYDQALKGSPNAKMGYFMVTTKMPKDTLKSHDEVVPDSFVEYEIEGNKAIIEAKEGIENLDQLLGKKVGDEWVFRGKLGSERKVKILRIMNRYLHLFSEITNEVHTNPFSDLPMESFDVREYMGEGKSIMDFFEKIGGKQDYDREQVIRDYYSGTLSFTDITGREYTGNYVRAYYDLKYEQKGIVEIPPTHYQLFPLSQYDYFILDFSSLLNLYQLTKDGIIEPNIKFRLARGIRHIIKSLQSEGLIIEGENYRIDRAFYQELLDWIDEHCDLSVSVSKLDILANAPEESKSDPMVNYFYDNVSLLMDSNKSLMITDDFQYTRVFPPTSGRLVSTRLFLYQCASLGFIKVNTK